MTSSLAIALLAAAIYLFGAFIVWAVIITILVIFASSVAVVFGLLVIEGGP